MNSTIGLSQNSVYTAKYLSLFFIECNGKPLSNLIVKLAAGLVTHELRTDQQGALPPIKFSLETTDCTVSVLLPTGSEEIVLNAQLNNEFQCYTCRSPYVLSKAQSAVHVAENDSNKKIEKKPEAKAEVKPLSKPIGTENETRSAGGNPVMEITVPEVDKVDNLKLVPNEQYREFILGASKLSGIIPQAIATLINAESGRKKEKYIVLTTVKGKVTVVKGKKVKLPDTVKKEEKERESGEWLPSSKNPRSTATGLSQFLSGSWIEQALIKDTHLFTEAVERGFIKNEPVQKVISKAVPAIKATKNRPAVPAKPAVTREQDKYVVKDKEKLLNMRNEPEYAIYVSVEYGMQNMTQLIKKTDYKVSKVNDSDKSKLFYLTHHLGIGDAKKFIAATITDVRAKRLLGDQVGVEKADVRADKERIIYGVDADSSYIFSHRRWLHDFIDSNIKPQRFAHDPSKIKKPQDLFALIKDIGGVHPVGFEVPPRKD